MADKQATQAAVPRFQLVSGYRVAPDHLYHFGHCWVRRDPGNRLRIGVDDFAAKTLGPPDRFKLPREGDTVVRDRAAVQWFRNDHRAQFLSPVTGKVFAVNPVINTSPDSVSEDPYEDGWLMVIEPAVMSVDAKHLYNRESVTPWIEDEHKTLMKLLGPEYERLAATGGEASKDLFGRHPEIGWRNLVSTFLHTNP
ncbi:MAG: glycine cleavage system protein H [Deltaproteobacteria bacterium]|nr:glycine cleavage system protein H [Deltaproteobacteria bacterium]